jgi:hypothetical protein
MRTIVFHINTRSKHQLHKPSANLSCFQKSTFYAVIKIFNSLPPSLTILKNNNAKFKEVLRKYLNKHFFYSVDEFFMCKDLFWSQWSRGLRHGSAAARLLGFWVRIQPVAWMLVSCECCMFQVDVSATSWSLVQRSPTECGVSECDHKSSMMRMPWPSRAVAPWYNTIL